MISPGYSYENGFSIQLFVFLFQTLSLTYNEIVPIIFENDFTLKVSSFSLVLLLF